MTTATLTLTEFLLARIAEDEAAAREAIAERDRIDFIHPPEVPDQAFEAWPDAPVPAVLVGPERVLAECEAKLAIVDLAWKSEEMIDAELGSGRNRAQMEARSVCPPELQHLAAIYADHPDYREDWRP